MRYTLMQKDHAVLEMELDNVTGSISRIHELCAPDRVPVGIAIDGITVDRADLNHWWLSRSIPASRSGIRDALEHLGVGTPQMLLTKCFGLSLSDQYWTKPAVQDLTWGQVNFFENPFSEDVGNILFGMAPATKAVDLISPDNTSDGMLRKRWKIIDGTRCLIKGGSRPFHQEPLNEVFATKLMTKLGVDHIPYHLIWMEELPYSVCPDFITVDTELVSAHHISKVLPRGSSDTKYDHYLRCCDALGIPGIRPQLDRMLVIDYLMANEDRHMGNFGAIRNVNTLEWVGPAPIFDCGTSLWHDHLFRWGGAEMDAPSKPFAERHDQQVRLVQSFDWLDSSALKEAGNDLADALGSASRFIDDTRIEIICEGFMNRADRLNELIQELHRGPEQSMNL